MAFTPLPKALVKGTINYKGQRRALIREQFFRIARRFTPLLIAEQNGLRFYVRTDDVGVGRVTFADMSIERVTLDNALDCLEALGTPAAELRDGTFVDIGANIGTTSITAVASGRLGRAICIEPLEDNRTLLAQNIELNGVADRVKVLPFAVSDREGEVSFERSADNWGDGRVRVRTPAPGEEHAFGEAERPTIEVRSTTFDALVAAGEVSLDEAALVWIDAQGHEAQILAGAGSLLGSQVPVVAEFWPYGLRRADGLERFAELVATGFNEFIDLGTVDDPRNPRRRPAAEVSALTAEYGGVEFTDLLLLN